MAPSSAPVMTPPTMSDMWCIRTTTRLIATMIATATHKIAQGIPVNDTRMIAAKVADDACPLGKLDVLGVRRSNRVSPETVGRSRLNSRLIP